MIAPDQWTTPWPQTFVTPLFVGGPADGKRDEPRPRCELLLRIKVPQTFVPPLFDGPFDMYVYRMGPYRDAFTVEYR